MITAIENGKEYNIQIPFEPVEDEIDVPFYTCDGLLSVCFLQINMTSCCVSKIRFPSLIRTRSGFRYYARFCQMYPEQCLTVISSQWEVSLFMAVCIMTGTTLTRFFPAVKRKKSQKYSAR